MDFSGVVSIVKTTHEGTISVGTGFFVKEFGLILTCYHVVKKVGCCSIGDPIGFIFEGQTQVFSGNLDGFDATVDVALVYTNAVQPKGYGFSFSGKEGDTFNTLGFPEGSLSGVVAHPLFERISPNKLVELKNANDICQGFSGAPLLDKNELVAGIIRIIPKSIREKGSMLYLARAIPIETIIEKFPDRFRHNYTTNNVAVDSSTRIKENVILVPKELTDSYTKKENMNWQSQDIDNVAEETFNDLIRIWLDKSDVNLPSRLTNDSKTIDFMVELPSMQPGMPNIQTFWKVKSSSKKLEKYCHPKLGIDYFRLNFPQKIINSLREISKQHEHVYLAFAHNSLNAQPFELYQCTLQERFEWYCVDLCQQFTNGAEENFIMIPTCNRLNLSTFSLLWSSLWVEKFYHPLYNSAFIEIPNMMDIIRITHPYKNERLLELEDWNSLSKKLSIYESELGKNEYAKISFPIGVGYSIEVIKKKLYDASADLTTIQNYCPESLYGTASLWLFSRSYHGFMAASGQAVSMNNRNSNLRILPLPDAPKNISGLFKVCLWHIVLLYSSLDVEVRIIYRPSLGAGLDHSYYGGGIGYFPWLSLSDDGVTWMVEQGIDVTSGQHLDFINEHMDNLYITPYYSNLMEIANDLNLHINDLRTAPMCPIQLFPKKGRFIDYPYSIFGNSAYRSLNSIKLKLS